MIEHEAYGLGIYSFFGAHGGKDDGVRVTSAEDAPAKPGIRIVHVTTFSGANGGIDHAVNDRGEATHPGELRFFAGVGGDIR